jgi:hypothetical protein
MLQVAMLRGAIPRASMARVPMRRNCSGPTGATRSPAIRRPQTAAGDDRDGTADSAESRDPIVPRLMSRSPLPQAACIPTLRTPSKPVSWASPSSLRMPRDGSAATPAWSRSPRANTASRYQSGANAERSGARSGGRCTSAIRPVRSRGAPEVADGASRGWRARSSRAGRRSRGGRPPRGHRRSARSRRAARARTASPGRAPRR